MSKNFLKSSLENATLNIILQISFRVVTFLLNAFVVRHVSPDAIGVMYVRLLLLESTILFLSREAFRKACLSKTDEHDWRKVINLVWFTVPLCLLFCCLFGYVWLYVLIPPSESTTRHYVFGVLSIAISCIIDMFGEPLHLVSQAFLLVKLRVFADILLVLVRTVVFVLLIVNSADNAVLAFSIAQILSVSAHILFFYVYFYRIIGVSNCKKAVDGANDLASNFPFRSMSDFFPKYVRNEEQIDWKMLKLIFSFFKQGIMMQLLTEGERYVMTLLNVLTFAEQGVFDIVNNLGSLAARFLFRPIEESSYFYFSQLIHRDQEINEQNKKSMTEVAFVLQHLLGCVTSLGLLVLCFGQGYAKMALFLYGGKELASGLGPKLMRTHCLAILLMAVNGSTECFALSTVSAEKLDRFNRVMVFFSVGYLICAWILSSTFGSVGFILANCCNMFARIIHSTYVIRQRYSKTNFSPLAGLKPKKYFSSLLILSTICTQISEAFFFEESPILHFIVGAIFFTITSITWLYEERAFIAFCQHNWKMKKQ